MKHAPAISPARKELSKAFLRELLMDNRLRTVSGFVEGEDLRLPDGVSLPSAFPVSQEPVERGQIRLLSQMSFPTYVAVLDMRNEDGFLVAPFSRFGRPATDEEFLTAYDGGAFMRVLQIWNARTATESTLRRSWLVGTLPKQDLDDALLLWKWSVGDVAEVPERISERTGVPIYRTDDPRLDYRREALENFAAFDAGALRQKDAFWENARRLGLVCRVAEPGPVVSAAAASLGSNPRRMFLVDALPARLRGEYSRSEKAVLFSVWDKDRRAKSAALDGFRIRMEGVDEDVPIRGMVARVPVPDPAAGFVLLDSKGKPIKMDPER